MKYIFVMVTAIALCFIGVALTLPDKSEGRLVIKQQILPEGSAEHQKKCLAAFNEDFSFPGTKSSYYYDPSAGEVETGFCTIISCKVIPGWTKDHTSYPDITRCDGLNGKITTFYLKK